MQVAKDPRCRECGRRGTLVLDRTAGDMVCSSCGLVQRRHIDPGVEWRNFGDPDSSSTDNGDPVRVGAVANPLLSAHGGMATDIDGGSGALARAQRDLAANAKDRMILTVLQRVGTWCSRIELPAVVRDAAGGVFKS